MAAIGPPSNSYEILSRLAEGGMAELFLARVANAAGNRRYVVLKRIAKERAGDTQFVRMFLDEAKLAAQLRHPNIAQVYDIGRLGTSYFFTMEYVHGVTVHQLVTACSERRQPVPVAAVLAVLAGTAAGLDHAHEKTGPDGRSLGIVHRDISPSNVLLSYEGAIKVVDFGIAKAHGRPETVAGEIKGKVGYMSPEQCRLQKLDRRSDLYSLGILGWEMLTAKRLWKRETAFGTMAAIATESAPLPSLYRSDLPPEVDKLIGKLLATEVTDRFQSAREVIEAIDLVSQSTRTSIASAQLARLLRDLFGAPVEPWMAGVAPDVVTVLTTPVPADFETLDDPALGVLGEVEKKLTTSFPSVSSTHDVVEDISTTNVRALPKIPAGPDDSLSTEDRTREVPALAAAPLATNLPRMTDIERAQQPFGDDDDEDELDAMSTINASRSDVLDEMVTLSSPNLKGPGQPAIDPARTMLGAGSPLAPNRLPPPASSPPPMRPSPAVPFVPATVVGAIPNSAPLGIPASHGSVPISSVPATVVGSIPASGAVPTQLPNSGPASASLPSGPRGRPPSSGPRPRPSEAGYGSGAANAIPGSGPQLAPRPSDALRPSDVKVPRWPPPPHGDVRLLRWWILGGFGLGVVIVVVILLATSGGSQPDTHDAAIVITANPADAMPDISVTPITPDAPIDAAEPDAAAPVDAAPTTKLRTKDALNTAFRAKQYKDIVAACREIGAVDDRANVCTLAACRANDDVAQDWYRNLTPKQRDFALKNCKQVGHPIDDVCAVDGICKQ